MSTIEAETDLKFAVKIHCQWIISNSCPWCCAEIYIIIALAFQEIAVIFFAADDNDTDLDGYDQLFKYLVDRQRCAVFGSIGDSIKDMYLWPLTRKSAVPSVLLPFAGPGLYKELLKVMYQ